MIPKIIHQLDHTYRYEYWAEGIRFVLVAETLQEAVDKLIAGVKKDCGKTITKDDIKYWEWDFVGGMDIVVPYPLEEGFRAETVINQQRLNTEHINQKRQDEA